MDQKASMCRASIVSDSRATLSNITLELCCHILSFLSYDEIILCSLTCRTMYTTVKNSVELQYAIELDAQGLVPVHQRPPAVSTAECLRILRDKANAWSLFKLDKTKRLRFKWLPNSWSITHRQLGLACYPTEDASTMCGCQELDKDVRFKVIDTKTCTSTTANVRPCTWSEGDPVPGTFAGVHYIDETRDLLVTVDIWYTGLRRNSKYQINFRTLSTGKEHPLANGSQLVIVTRAPCKPISSDVQNYALVEVLGDHLALYGEMTSQGHVYWSLHVWNWREGQADDICVIGEDYVFVDICFLTKEKLLALTSRGHIELYDVEDLSKAPQLQARFTLPICTPHNFRFQYPSVFHGASSCAHLVAPDERWIWTTNPADRVICVTDPFCRTFIITARVFFSIPPSWFGATSEDGRTIPWSLWGPQNSRGFQDTTPRSVLGVGGSRVIWVVPKGPDDQSLVHVMDFNPSAVARGFGKVVREATTINTPLSPHSNPEQYIEATTYLPYVEVVGDRILNYCPSNVTVDEEQVLLFEAEDATGGRGVEIIDL
ncbi:hypothetical protein DFH29DRAFT_651373 [Suillus ampliporus]|nr:hypothetical protein DFH29DRAFT_651373 [Suillus ampliporus]